MRTEETGSGGSGVCFYCNKGKCFEMIGGDTCVVVVSISNVRKEIDLIVAGDMSLICL